MMNRINQVGDTNISSEGRGGTTYNTNNRLNASFIGNGNVSSTAFSQINQLIQNQTDFHQTLISILPNPNPINLLIGDISVGNVWTIVSSGGDFKGSWVAPTSRSISDFTSSLLNTDSIGVYKIQFNTNPGTNNYQVFLSPRMNQSLNPSDPIIQCHLYAKAPGNFKVRCREDNTSNQFGSFVNNEFDFMVVVNNDIYCSGTVLANGNKGS